MKISKCINIIIIITLILTMGMINKTFDYYKTNCND